MKSKCCHILGTIDLVKIGIVPKKIHICAVHKYLYFYNAKQINFSLIVINIKQLLNKSICMILIVSIANRLHFIKGISVNNFEV